MEEAMEWTPTTIVVDIFCTLTIYLEVIKFFLNTSRCQWLFFYRVEILRRQVSQS